MIQHLVLQSIGPTQFVIYESRLMKQACTYAIQLKQRSSFQLLKEYSLTIYIRLSFITSITYIPFHFSLRLILNSKYSHPAGWSIVSSEQWTAEDFKFKYSIY